MLQHHIQEVLQATRNGLLCSSPSTPPSTLGKNLAKKSGCTQVESTASDNPSSYHTRKSLAHVILPRSLDISKCIFGTLSMGRQAICISASGEGNHHRHNSSCDAIVVPADIAPYISFPLEELYDSCPKSAKFAHVQQCKHCCSPKQSPAAGRNNACEDNIGGDAPSIALHWPAGHHAPTCRQALA